MEVRTKSKRLKFLGLAKVSQSELQSRQETDNEPLNFLERWLLQTFLRFYIYIGWVALVIFVLLPALFSCLRPFWRIICWVAPTLLAVEVDAGNRTWVYVSKTVIWILQVILAQYLLGVSGAFREEPNPKLMIIGIVIATLLFLPSCVLTIVGRMKKDTVWFRGGLAKASGNLRYVDETVYVNWALESPQIKANLSRGAVKLACISDGTVEDGYRLLTEEQVSHHVIRTSLVTQFVVARVFKDVNNRVFVYCPVAQYRAILLTSALVVAGIVHIGQDLFEARKGSEVVTSMILWLTLPSITLPSLVRIKFGNHATLLYLLRGLLPADTDEQMWKRLGISAQDLYTALTNAVFAEKVLKGKVGLVERPGVGTVKVSDKTEANCLCIKSLLRVGDQYVRISDGNRFKLHEPGSMLNLSKLEVRWPDYGDKFGREGSIRLNKLEESSSSESETGNSPTVDREDSHEQAEFFLNPDTRILRMIK